MEITSTGSITLPETTNPDTGDLLVTNALNEKRASVSLKKPAVTVDEADDESGDDDVVADRIEDLLEEAETQLEEFGQEVLEKVEFETEKDQEEAEEFVEELNELNIDEVEVETTNGAGRTVLKTDDGERAVVWLEDGEASREVQVGDETFLVIADDLTIEEVRFEIGVYISGKIRSIVENFNVSASFESYLDVMSLNGFDMFASTIRDLFDVEIVLESELLNERLGIGK